MQSKKRKVNTIVNIKYYWVMLCYMKLMQPIGHHEYDIQSMSLVL